MSDHPQPGDSTIALAVYPRPIEALPALLEALGGPGRPAGIVRCEAAGESALENVWDAKRTAPSVVFGLIDVELQRFHGYRTAKLLAPLSIELQALIAADGLRAPEIAPDRILEVLIDAFE